MGNQWLFPDGTILPVVSGGSDEGLNLPTSIPLNQPDPEPEYSDFARGILDKIPETDRPIVGKYIKDWDGNVTKQFQKIHEEYKPYKELGPVEDLLAAREFIQRISDDPLGFYDDITSALRENGMLGKDDDGQPSGGLPEFEGLPEQFVTQFKSMEERLNQWEEKFGSFEQEKETERAIAQVDNLLKTLHNDHGDFDEEFVLSKLANGASPEDAIKSWNDLIQKVQQPKKAAPNLIPGAGAIPNGQVDLSKMNPQEKLKYLAQRIEQAANS